MQACTVQTYVHIEIRKSFLNLYAPSARSDECSYHFMLGLPHNRSLAKMWFFTRHGRALSQWKHDGDNDAFFACCIGRIQSFWSHARHSCVRRRTWAIFGRTTSLTCIIAQIFQILSGHRCPYLAAFKVGVAGLRVSARAYIANALWPEVMGISVYISANFFFTTLNEIKANRCVRRRRWYASSKMWF